MADGATHTAATVTVAVPAAVTAGLVTGDPGLAALAGAGCLAGVFISPDLDVNHRTESELLLWQVSPLVGFPFLLAWFPYAYVIDHRSPVSHLPLLGTLGRLLYLCAVLALVQVHLNLLPVRIDLFFWTRYPTCTAVFVAGLALSDLVHWLLDGLPLSP